MEEYCSRCNCDHREIIVGKVDTLRVTLDLWTIITEDKTMWLDQTYHLGTKFIKDNIDQKEWERMMEEMF